MKATISNVTEGTAAHEAGLVKGDTLLSINGNPVSDIIDFMYHSQENVLDLEILRGKTPLSIKIKRKENAPLGFELKSFRTKKCLNKCVFCFVNQLPKGLRKPLYLKDDDYRMSFLYGNYITLTNITSKEKQRILSQKLSPLYISVHTTNNELRRKMLGNPKAPDILKEIAELTAHKIRLHVQIVLCPGLNDCEELENTIRDLQKFYPYIESIAVVPVGLTKHKKGGVRPVEKKDAVEVIETVKQFRRRLKRRHGDPLVYLADEFYIKAGAPFPLIRWYGDLPQIENGVGLVPAFQHCSRSLKLPKKIEPKKVAVITGASFVPYLEEYAKKLRTIDGLSIDIIKVENKFFGPSVTVAGLLTGKDILKTVFGRTKADCLLVPDVALKEGTDMLLDNVTLRDLEESLGMNVVGIESTPQGLLKGVTDECKRED
jgi:putative radical SAM enzyme (TIGR03279 family)